MQTKTCNKCSIEKSKDEFGKCNRTKSGILPICKSCRSKYEKERRIKEPFFEAWRSMIRRCHEYNSKDYFRYGERGIYVCDEWRSFSTFKKWALENGYKKGLQIDRIDNDNSYFPENCHYVSAAENSRNRRSTKLSMEIARKVRSLKGKMLQIEIADMLGVNKNCVSKIIRNKSWIETSLS